MSSDDPAVTDPDHYKVIFENDRVRVLEYHDQPGDKTHPHLHPDSVMYSLTSFRRRVSDGDRSVDVEIPAGAVRWLGAQTHTIFVELKEPGSSLSNTVLGPQG